jgi:hypothetical protein
MTIRSVLLAFTAIAAVALSSLAPADAAVFGPRHFARGVHHLAFAHRVGPGVSWCRRGIVYVCQ